MEQLFRQRDAPGPAVTLDLALIRVELKAPDVPAPQHARGGRLQEREKFTATLGHFLGELAALRTLTYYGAWKADQKMDARSEAANVKLFGTELLHKIIDFAIEVAGPAVLRKEHAVARAFRHARSRRIVEGPSEIQRHIIQRALFREGADSLELM